MASVTVPLHIQGASRLVDAPNVGPAMLLQCEFVMPLLDLVNAMAYQKKHEAAAAACAEPRSAPSSVLNPKAPAFPKPKPELKSEVIAASSAVLDPKAPAFPNPELKPEVIDASGAVPDPKASAFPKAEPKPEVSWQMRSAGVTWDEDILEVILLKESYEEAPRTYKDYRHATSWRTRGVAKGKFFLSEE